MLDLKEKIANKQLKIVFSWYDLENEVIYKVLMDTIKGTKYLSKMFLDCGIIHYHNEEIGEKTFEHYSMLYKMHVHNARAQGALELDSSEWITDGEVTFKLKVEKIHRHMLKDKRF